MISVNVRDLRRNLSSYINAVEQGSTVYIIRHGCISAKIEQHENALRPKSPTPETSLYPTLQTPNGIVIFRKWERRDEHRVIHIMYTERVHKPVESHWLVLPEHVFKIFMLAELEDGSIIAFGAIDKRDDLCNFWVHVRFKQTSITAILTKILNDAAITT